MLGAILTDNGVVLTVSSCWHGSRMKSLVAGTVDRLRIQLLEEITDSRFQANIGFHRAAVDIGHLMKDLCNAVTATEKRKPFVAVLGVNSDYNRVGIITEHQLNHEWNGLCQLAHELLCPLGRASSRI